MTFAAAAAGAIAGCQSKSTAEAEGGTPALSARMKGITSSARGQVVVYPRKGGVALEFNLANVPPGPYRLALHGMGGCSSPNGFSAGPAWAPPGSTKVPGDLIPGFSTNSEGTAVLVAFVPGVQIEGPQGLLGRTVVLHWGSTVKEAFAGVPNDRVACAVFEPVSPLF